MKISFSLNRKEASLEADVEKLVEKGLEYKNKNPNKKTRHQIKHEELRKNKELEHKQFLQGVLVMMGTVVFILIICVLGAIIFPD